MKKVCMFAMTICLVVGLAASTASAAVIVTDDNENWSFEGVIPPASPLITSLVAPSADVHGSGSAGVQITAGSTGSGIREDHVYALTPSVLIGDLTNISGESVFGIEFDFYLGSTAYAPAELSLYFQENSLFTWYYDLAVPSSPGWNHYTIILPSSYGAWYSLDSGSSAQDALTDVTRMGLRLSYAENVTGPQLFGIGNFEYHGSESYYIPEPGTYMMLSTALMSLGYTFAKRRRAQKKAVAA